MFGIEEFAAIINPPAGSDSRCWHRRPSPLVEAGAVVVATVMNLTLSVDHRAVDGALAATLMAALVGHLEEPLRLVV